jgi:hypothetical protein
MIYFFVSWHINKHNNLLLQIVESFNIWQRSLPKHQNQLHYNSV